MYTTVLYIFLFAWQRLSTSYSNKVRSIRIKYGRPKASNAMKRMVWIVKYSGRKFTLLGMKIHKIHESNVIKCAVWTFTAAFVCIGLDLYSYLFILIYILSCSQKTAKDGKMSKRYCNIKNCENNKGVCDKTVLFFRLPKEADKKKLWINAIKKYQFFDENSPNANFSICEKHFQANEINRLRVRDKLAPNAVPVIGYFFFFYFNISSSMRFQRMSWCRDRL